MKPEDHNGEVVDQGEDATQEFSVDKVSKGLANGTLSRPQALRMAGAALLSAALVPFLPKQAQAADNFTTRCTRKGGTVCSTGAGKICCPEDSICGQGMGGNGSGICVKRASIDWQNDCGPASGSLLCPQGMICATCGPGALMGRGLCAETVSPLRLGIRAPS